MRVETKRMYLYPLSDEEMRLVIEIGYGLKEEYRPGCLEHYVLNQLRNLW